MGKHDNSTEKRNPKRKGPEQSEKRAKDLGPPKDKAGKLKGGRAYSSSDVRLKRSIRPL